MRTCNYFDGDTMSRSILPTSYKIYMSIHKIYMYSEELYRIVKLGQLKEIESIDKNKTKNMNLCNESQYLILIEPLKLNSKGSPILKTLTENEY